MDPHALPDDVQSYVDLVFEGGGVRGIALVGALSVLEEHGFKPQNLAGTSAGAIVATLLAAGYSAAELTTILEQMDFRQFKDTGWEDRVPIVGPPLSLVLAKGIYEGEAFYRFIRDLLAQKNVHTFADLVHPAFADDQRYRYRVQVVASDVTARRMLILPHHASLFGIEPDELEVALAVRMSMSIPFYFEPVHYLNKTTRQDHLIVDGGMLSNYPVWLFDSDGEPDWPTFGLRLVEHPGVAVSDGLSPPEPTAGGDIGLVDYVKALVETMMSAHDRRHIEGADYCRTIAIPTLGVRSTDFDLPRQRVLQLYESGRQAATSFLHNWDFKAYIAEFRSGRTHSRRRMLNEILSQAGADAQPPDA